LADAVSHAWIFIVLGLTSGCAYALTASGIVTVYRGSGVLNFSHCAVGMAGAYGFYAFYGGGLAKWPVVPAIVAGIVFSILLNLIIYLLIMRRLVRATQLARVVATIGVLIILQGLAAIHYGTYPIVVSFLSQNGVQLGSATLAYSTIVVMVALAVATISLWAMFRFTRLGLAATALQERPDAARALGISPTPVGVVVWATGGALAAVAAILLLPVTQLSPSQSTSLLFPAFAAALLGRFRSYGMTVVAGLAIGIFESLLIGYNWPTYLVNVIPFAVIIIALMLGGTTIPRRSLLTAELPKLGDGRLRPIWAAVAFALAVGTIFWSTSSWSLAVVASAVAGIIGLSFVVATGYAGQITFLPFAIAGVAAAVGAQLASAWHFPFLANLVLSLIVGGVAGAASGLPAFRVRGIELAVTTLCVALAVETSVFTIPALTNDNQGVLLPSPELFGLDINTTTEASRYAVTSLVIFTVACLAVLNLRRSRSGRRLVSVRGNERGALSLGISVFGAKVAAFAFSGALAGAAGIIMLYLYPTFSTGTNFSSLLSMTALAFVIVGGVGMVSGSMFAAVLGAGGVGVYWFRNYSAVDSWLMVIAGVFVIYVMLTHPDGQADLFVGLIRRFSGRLTGRIPRFARTRSRPAAAMPPGAAMPGAADGPTADGPTADGAPPAPAGRAGRGSALRATGLTIRYGPVLAVDSVDLEVNQGSVLGIIGSNGAGKTTLLDGLTGFTRVASGTVWLDGDQITSWEAGRRARSGLIRTFQNLELFTELSVRENLLAASDQRDRSAYLVNLLRPGKRQLTVDAELVSSMLGLESLLGTPVRDLPTGTQRLVALARAIAARPSVLCLDEPTAGLNEQERAAFTAALRRVVQTFGLGVILVEHNVDVVAEVCDDLLVLDFGSILAAGPTAEILRSDAVRSAYLGESGAQSPRPDLAPDGERS
jgi:ABC-type branched-subunit amino acid transport system ATPase component/branched-subunit amino acid ABC-type transport system permease component